MAFVPRFFALVLILSFAWIQAETPVVRFRSWIAGQEAGGAEQITTTLPNGVRMDAREWMQISRGADQVRQEAKHSATRRPDGSLTFTWAITIAADPMEGKASWSPSLPETVRVEPKGGVAKDLMVPQGAILWPGDLEARQKEAARTRSALRLVEFNPEGEGWNELDMACLGPDPLPGFPDAVKFKGRVQEGPMKLEAELWISPSAGELRQSTQFMGLPLLVQRAELPAPGGPAQASLFDRTMKRLPHHPFALWVPELTVRWTGAEKIDVPEDAQQRKEGDQRLVLRSAALPSPEEAAELPSQGKPSAEDAPFLAASPLVPFKDPIFEGVMYRLAPKEGATRWELARQVNRFVFDWITQKDYTVGFAGAAEVCRDHRGDCTEHAVLAVALLRRLGVPARGAMGWVALGDTLALHFWVEVKLKSRWIPIDPTFDQAPASAFRVKLGSTDLANLASVGWDSAAQVFGSGQWLPEKEGPLPWGKGWSVQGEVAAGAAIGRLTLAGEAWTVNKGHLGFQAFGREHETQAVLRPTEAQLQGAIRTRSAGDAPRRVVFPPRTNASGSTWTAVGSRWRACANPRPRRSWTCWSTRRRRSRQAGQAPS
jgi:hypothetical protein